MLTGLGQVYLHVWQQQTGALIVGKVSVKLRLLGCSDG